MRSKGKPRRLAAEAEAWCDVDDIVQVCVEYSLEALESVD
jgi:hypothetical protein